MKTKLSPYAIPSIAGIEQVVCDEYNLDVEQLNIRTRKRQIKEARQICMWWRATYTKESLSVIGNRYAGPGNPKGFDHATVLHAKKTVNNIKDTDRVFAEMIDRIKQRVSLLALRTKKWKYLEIIAGQIETQVNELGELFDQVKKEDNGFAGEFTDMHYAMSCTSKKLQDKFAELAEKNEKALTAAEGGS